MSPALKSIAFTAACALISSPVMADATMYSITAKAESVINAKMTFDANSPKFQIAVGKFGVVDTALGTNDADYEAVLEDRGMKIGAVLYGDHDASYDAWLTPAHFFDTAALGQNDADYEPVLVDRNITIGAALYGKYDADYDAILFPQTGGCQTGSACF